jgi:hypothetical protein
MKWRGAVKTNLIGLLGLAFLLALSPAALAGTTWYVNGVSGSDTDNCLSPTTACKTVRHTISLALSGDTIRVAAATYTENLTLDESLNILGAGASTTIIDGGGARTVVTIPNSTAHVTLSKLTIRNGKASSGGGINNSGILTLTNSTVSGNSAPIPCMPLGLVCLLRGTASGGGIYNSGALIVSNSLISGNHAGSFCNALPCSAFGGGIYSRGTLMIENSTLTGNSAGTACSTSINCSVGVGGAFYTIGGPVTLNNSTVEGNSAYRCSGVCSYTGGAIVNGSGDLAMHNATVSGNSAGGVFNDGIATLQNSIVANNSDSNCGGTITSDGYNLSSDGSCAFTKSGDRNDTNPMLGTLGYYGGPTPTVPLLTGSPAIDAGDPSGCTDGSGHLLKIDQRGMPRPDPEDSGGCDLGAYESQGVR